MTDGCFDSSLLHKLYCSVDLEDHRWQKRHRSQVSPGGRQLTLTLTLTLALALTGTVGSAMNESEPGYSGAGPVLSPRGAAKTQVAQGSRLASPFPRRELYDRPIGLGKERKGKGRARTRLLIRIYAGFCRRMHAECCHLIHDFYVIQF